MPIYQDAPKTVVLQLANQANAPTIPFTEQNVAFGTPVVLTGNPNANTEVAVRGVQDKDYFGRRTLQYNRLDLGTLFNGGYQPVVSALGQSTLHRLLPELNKALGTNFTVQDLLDIDLTLLDPGDQVVLNLQAAAESIGYTGSIMVLYNRIRQQLYNVVQTRVLPELNHPDPVQPGYASAGLLTWGLDFTLISQYLRVNPYAAYYRGDWADLVGLQTALATEYGIASWPGIDASQTALDSVRDYATNQLPEANQDFKRVVVQTHVNANGYVGTAYFHYNL